MTFFEELIAIGSEFVNGRMDDASDLGDILVGFFEDFFDVIVGHGNDLVNWVEYTYNAIVALF